MSAPRFAELVVGDSLPALDAGTITTQQLRAFAESSGDMNPIHLDAEAARAAGLPGIIAHGMLNMAFLGRLVTGWAPRNGLRRLETRFLAMAVPGDTITCLGTVSGKRQADGEQIVELAIEARNQKGETLLAGAATVALR